MCWVLMCLEGKCCLRESSLSKGKRRKRNCEAGILMRASVATKPWHALSRVPHPAAVKVATYDPGCNPHGLQDIRHLCFAFQLLDLAVWFMLYQANLCFQPACTHCWLFTCKKALILDHNNSIESQASVHICAKICKVPKQLNWGSFAG